MDLSGIKVSIIVPIYNDEKYLRECIRSIQNQTHKNLEIILINDGSMDSSESILSEFEKKDERIIIINKNNTGVSNTRNIGLSVAKGEYICFSDADDYLSDDYVEYLLRLVIYSKADVALTSQMFGNFSLRQTEKVEISVVNPEKATLSILTYKIPIGVYSKMFKKEFLRKNSIYFLEDLFMGEGFNFNVDAFQRANRVCISNRKIYYYRRNNASSVTTNFSVNKWENALYAIKTMNRRIQIDKKNIDRALQFALWRTYSDAYDSAVLSTKKNKQKIKEYKKKVMKKGYIAFEVPTSLKNKVRALTMMICPEVIPMLLILRQKKYNVKF